MRRTWVMSIALVACGATDEPQPLVAVTSSCTGFVSMVTNVGLDCSDGGGAGVLLPSGTKIETTCSLTQTGICFAAGCLVDPPSEATGSGQIGSCVAIATAATKVSCACLEATR